MAKIEEVKYYRVSSSLRETRVFRDEHEAYLYCEQCRIEEIEDKVSKLDIPKKGWCAVRETCNPYTGNLATYAVFDGMLVGQLFWAQSIDEPVYEDDHFFSESFRDACSGGRISDYMTPEWESKLHSDYEKHNGAYHSVWNRTKRADAWQYSHVFDRDFVVINITKRK